MYCVVVKYKGFDWVLDRKIENLCPEKYDGGGFCFRSGSRDTYFFGLKTYNSALSLAAKARRLRKIKGLGTLTAKVFVDKDEN